jgi:hypothetical protein
MDYLKNVFFYVNGKKFQRYDCSHLRSKIRCGCKPQTQSGILCVMYAWLTPDESTAAQNAKIARSLLPHLFLSHPLSCYIVSVLSTVLPIT